MNDLKLDSRTRRRVKFCPCGKSNRDGKFVPFVGHEEFGKCHSCGEKFLPKIGTRPEPEVHYDPAPKPVHIIPDSFMIESLGHSNAFTAFLLSRFPESEVNAAVELYQLGTWQKSFGWPYWSDGVCFWQIDTQQRSRQVKVMRYDPETGKRIKPDGSYLVGRKLLESLNITDPNLVQCFFGEHLINEFPDKVMGLVESEKTAVIASLLIPEILWLATGGSNGCRWYDPSVFKVLKCRQVVLYPDNDKVEQWSEKVKDNKLHEIASVSICRNFYEGMQAGEENFDLADYLLMAQPHQHATTEATTQEPHVNEVLTEDTIAVNPVVSAGSQEIEGVEKFFKNINLPDRVTLDACSVITDPAAMVQSHLSIVKHNPGPGYRSYFDRLDKLRTIIINN